MLKRVLMFCGLSLAASAATAATAFGATAAPVVKAANGKTVHVVAEGLGTPTSFAFGGGTVFEGDGGVEGQNGPTAPGGVFQLQNGKAARLPGSPDFVSGLVWHKGTLYIAGATMGAQGPSEWFLLGWSGWKSGKFASQKRLFTAPKGFPGFNGLAFGPDGRLYAGVDVGFSNDHGPATKKTPYLYDILSFNAKGKNLKVFATGMRQPWQLAFPAGSKSPFVTDLGQDTPKGVKAPDQLLRVKQGDNYGFPQCNRTKAKLCKGFTKPFKLFAPHTDIGGIGIIGKTIYISEFGMGGVTPPRVVSLKSTGGAAKPFLTGFAAPVIGLGVSHGWVYVGDLTGHVYRVHS